MTEADLSWEYGPCDGCGTEVETIRGMWTHIDNPGRFCWRAVSRKASQILSDHRGNRINRGVATQQIIDLVQLAYEEGKLVAAIEWRDRDEPYEKVDDN